MPKEKRVMTLELSDDDLTEAVTQWAERRGDIKLNSVPRRKINVDIKVESRLEGYGMGEHPVYSGKVVLTVEG